MHIHFTNKRFMFLIYLVPQCLLIFRFVYLFKLFFFNFSNLNLKVKVKCALCFYKPFKDEGKQRKEGNVKQTNQTPPPQR